MTLLHRITLLLIIFLQHHSTEWFLTSFCCISPGSLHRLHLKMSFTSQYHHMLMVNRFRAKSNQRSRKKHHESTFRSHMSRKRELKSTERVSPLMNRTCFICETSSRYGRARPQAQMAPASQPPPQSRPVYGDVKLAEGSRAASAREVAHTD